MKLLAELFVLVNVVLLIGAFGMLSYRFMNFIKNRTIALPDGQAGFRM